MNATNSRHPAESPEFLSRLHDGELSPPEVASFEEHRRRCERCRESADSYTRALSIFRSASPRPPASDLSARILRKVRAQSPSRRPFGVTFGIDVRWAGVCAAALIVVIMAASILDEGPMPSIVLPAREAAKPQSVLARLLEKESPPANKERQTALIAAAPARGGAPSAPAPARPQETGGRVGGFVALEGQADVYAPAPPETTVRGEAPLVDSHNYLADGVNASTAGPGAEKDRVAAKSAPEAARADAAPAREEQKKTLAIAQAPRSRVSADAPGGESGAAAAAPAPSGAEENVVVLVDAADGFGSAPPLEPRSGGAGIAAFRGREFVLVVETSGRVRSAVPAASATDAMGEMRRKAAKNEREDLSAILELRFEASDRPRRLRIRVQ